MKSIRCGQCGLLNFAEAGDCKRCRATLDAADVQPEVHSHSVDTSTGGGARCGFCGLETTAAYCPRCKARVASPLQAATYERVRRGGGVSRARALRWLVALVVLAAVGGGAYLFRYRIWYGTGATYALAIREAELFKAPLSVTVKKSVTAANPTGMPLLVGQAGSSLASSEPVYVLEARGLVQFGAVSTQERVVGTISSAAAYGYADSDRDSSPIEIKRRYDSATAALTPQGQQEAAAWTDTGDTWRVPIGTREVYRVEKVGDLKTAGGAETREVEFSWRWIPNPVGEAFDPGGKVFDTLPERARTAAEMQRWNSTNAYRAVAILERRAGGDWRVVEIRKSEHFDTKTELSAF